MRSRGQPGNSSVPSTFRCNLPWLEQRCWFRTHERRVPALRRLRLRLRRVSRCFRQPRRQIHKSLTHLGILGSKPTTKKQVLVDFKIPVVHAIACQPRINQPWFIIRSPQIVVICHKNGTHTPKDQVASEVSSFVSVSQK